jgi:hypothetical protein
MLACRPLGIVVQIALTLIITNANALTDQARHYYRPIYRTITAASFRQTKLLSGGIRNSNTVADSNNQIVAHPAGCPRTLFCGCGAAQELGLSDPSLLAVQSWYKFPRAVAAPGMAVLWGERHVAAIRMLHEDNTATVYDANSGAGLTRIHRISLAGLVVVDPHVGHHGEPTFASFSPSHVEDQTSSIRAADHHEENKVASYVHTPAPHLLATQVSYRHRPILQNSRVANMASYRILVREARNARHEARLQSASGYWH